MKDFRTLDVWQLAHELALAVYKLTREFPRDETYGLTSQVRRCGASVPANIAEACGRTSSGDFHRFLGIAMGSAVELEYFLVLSRDLEYLPSALYETVNQQTLRVQRMLGSLIRKVGAARAGS